MLPTTTPAVDETPSFYDRMAALKEDCLNAIITRIVDLFHKQTDKVFLTSTEEGEILFVPIMYTHLDNFRSDPVCGLKLTFNPETCEPVRESLKAVFRQMYDMPLIADSGPEDFTLDDVAFLENYLSQRNDDYEGNLKSGYFDNIIKLTLIK